MVGERRDTASSLDDVGATREVFVDAETGVPVGVFSLEEVEEGRRLLDGIVAAEARLVLTDWLIPLNEDVIVGTPA